MTSLDTAHFGSPFTEQKALLGPGAVVRLDREVITVTGSDRISWLDSLTSHRIGTNASTQALILDPHGHIEYDLHVVDHAGTTWLSVDAGSAAGLVSYLDRMRFLMDVSVSDVSHAYSVWWQSNREVSHDFPTWLIPAEYAGTGRTDSGEDRGGAADKYVPARPGRLVGAEIFVPVDETPEGHAAGLWAFEALRIAAGFPRLGADGDHKSLPHELGLIGPGVHLAKGCYRGQETVARLHNMGRPPRRLVLLHFDGALPEVPADVEWDGRIVGRAGSAAQHYELGPIGLAVVKRSLPLDATLHVCDIAAAQEQIVTG